MTQTPRGTRTITRIALLCGCLLLGAACAATNDSGGSTETSTSTHEETMQTLTTDEAGERAKEHVERAVAALPVEPTLTASDAGSTECADPTDNGPRGRYQVTRSYWLDDVDAERNGVVVDALHDYWTNHGYRVLKDDRSSDDRYVWVEHEDDAFRMSVEQSVEGDLSLGAVSPCVWPDGEPPAGPAE